MKFLKYAALLVALCFASPAFAINCAVANGACFWIGGTGTLDLATDTLHWSNSSGGTTCACEPISTNSLTFDGSSGGGTITVNATINATSITASAFTGTIDWSVNNNNVNLSFTFVDTGAGGIQTIKLGSGTFTLTAGTTGAWDFSNSNLTLVAGTSTISFALTSGAQTTTFNGSGKTFNIVNFGPICSTCGGIGFAATATTIATLTATAPVRINFPGGITTTITNALVLAGSSSTQQILLASGDSGGSAATVHLSASGNSCTWCGLYHMIFNTNSFSATNAFDFGGNTLNGGTISPPAAGVGGGFIIGG